MARTLIAVTLLATFVGCARYGVGYEPAPDRRSDPLSREDRRDVEGALEGLGLACDIGDTLDDEPDLPDIQEVLNTEDELSRVAERRPHGVYRAEQDVFDGDTMIQVLERAAHEFDCPEVNSGSLSAVAKELRSRR